MSTTPTSTEAPKNGSSPAPATASTTNARNSTACRRTSLAAIVPLRSSTLSGSSMAAWTLARKIPMPAISVPSTSWWSYPATRAKTTATTTPIPVSTIRSPRMCESSSRRAAASSSSASSRDPVRLRPASLIPYTMLTSARTVP